MNRDILLLAIGATEQTTFTELCNALGRDCPERGDRKAWADLFAELRSMAGDGLIAIYSTGNQIEGAMLTEYGVEAARGARERRRAELDARRPLLA